MIRLAERSGGDPVRARAIAEEDLQAVPWLSQAAGATCIWSAAPGGRWRVSISRRPATRCRWCITTRIGREEARDLAGLISTAPRKVLERMPGAPRRRIDDLPFAAVALRRLLRVTGVRRVVFSASGLREGWFMRRMPQEIQEQDPLLSAAWEMAARHGRDPSLPPALVAWTEPLFPRESLQPPRGCGRRCAGCRISAATTIQSSERNRLFCGCCGSPELGWTTNPGRSWPWRSRCGTRRSRMPPFLRPARLLLDIETAIRAEVLGIALRLAYTLSAGTKDLLAGTRLRIEGPRLILQLRENSGVFAGESVIRRLERLAQALGLQATAEPDRATE